MIIIGDSWFSVGPLADFLHLAIMYQIWLIPFPIFSL